MPQSRGSRRNTWMALCTVLLLAVAGFAGLTATGSGAWAAAPAQEDAVVVELGDRTVTQSEFDELFTRFVRSLAAQQGLPMDESTITLMRDLRTDFLDQLATQQVLLAEAEARGIEVSEADLDAIIEQAMQNFPDQASFDATITEMGYADEEAFRTFVRENEAITQLVNELRAEIEITDEEVETFYTENPDLFATEQGTLPLEQVREAVRQELQTQELQAMVEELRAASGVEVFEGNLSEFGDYVVATFDFAAPAQEQEAAADEVTPQEEEELPPGAEFGAEREPAAYVLVEGTETIGEPVDQPLRAAAFGILNQRVNKEAEITSENVADLGLSWRIPITHPVSHAPLIEGDRVYFADWGGTVYAADANTGEIIWENKVEEPRMMWPWHGFAGTGTIDYDNGLLIEASVEGSAFALDLETGELVWQTQIAEQELGGNLSDMLYHDGLVYIGLSSPTEPLSKRMEEFIPMYQGNVVALDSQTGDEVWRTYTVEEPMNGATMWSSFALDEETGVLYFPTSNNYTGEPSDTSDAMFAVDARTGEVLWVNQVTMHDTWTLAVPVGPDYAFGAGAQLFQAEIDGEMRNLVGAGQKSGLYYAWDRETGEVVWNTFVGYPQVGGGIRGEAAVGNGRIYVWSNNSYIDGKDPSEFPITVKALDAATGRNLWFHDKAQPAVGTASAFLANDVVFVGSLDGTLQAYDASTGEILWQGSTPGAVASSPIVVGDTLYVGTGVPVPFGGGPATNGMFAFSLGGDLQLDDADMQEQEEEDQAADDEAETDEADEEAAAEAEITLTAATSDEYGEYLATADGRPVYLFTPDTAEMSTCYETCAERWPPVTVESLDNVQVGEAVDASALGVLEREDGMMQLVYNDHPLYYFAPDQGAAAPQGQGIESFGGEWYLLTPEGMGLEDE